MFSPVNFPRLQYAIHLCFGMSCYSLLCTQLSTLNLLNSAFDEGMLILLISALPSYNVLTHSVAKSYSRYTPGKSYHWEFPKGNICVMLYCHIIMCMINSL